MILYTTCCMEFFYIKDAQLFGDALKKQIAATNMAVAE